MRAYCKIDTIKIPIVLGMKSVSETVSTPNCLPISSAGFSAIIIEQQNEHALNGMAKTV